MEMLLLLAVFGLGYLVSLLQWYQPERKKAQGLVSELVRARTKAQALQIDLDRVAEKNRKWASEKVKALMQEQQSQQEWPRAQGWKKYQDSLQESELNRESDRQQAERNRWVQE